MMDLVLSIETMGWIGSLLGLAGSYLVALNRPCSGYGFVLFLLSNACWFAHGWLTGTYSMMLMQAGFTATSLIGIRRHLGGGRPAEAAPLG